MGSVKGHLGGKGGLRSSRLWGYPTERKTKRSGKKSVPQKFTSEFAISVGYPKELQARSWEKKNQKIWGEKLTRTKSYLESAGSYPSMFGKVTRLNSMPQSGQNKTTRKKNKSERNVPICDFGGRILVTNGNGI